MSRHIVDHRAASDGGRLKNFLAVERRKSPEGSHPHSQELMRRRPGGRADARRLAEFLRIEKGRLT